MILVGLTGGIGSGKSEVARLLAGHGAVVVDADVLAREAVAPGTPGLEAVVAAFGRGMLSEDGALDRAALGRLAFADPQHRATLEAIVHPAVARRRDELTAAAPPGGVVVHDIPLLVEQGMQDDYDVVVVVEAPAGERVARLVESRGMTEADVRARIATQATDEQRRAVADIVLRNDADLAALTAAVDELWHELRRGVHIARTE